MGNQSGDQPDEDLSGTSNPANRGLGAMDADGTRDAAEDQSKNQSQNQSREKISGDKAANAAKKSADQR